MNIGSIALLLGFAFLVWFILAARKQAKKLGEKKK